ncbi:acid protease [Favolaschia claudopus]|uniref:Acid protease n=1 Tax=Favolaschia claudopus TaxID=2862362 RepID=A0AAW0A995_9AGAR
MLLAACTTLLAVLPSFLGVSVAEPLHLPLLRNSGRVPTSQDHFEAAERTKARYGFLHNEQLAYGRQRRATAEDIGFGNETPDQFYFVDISIGSPPQAFKVMIETLMSDVWVGAQDCAGCPSGVALYDPTKSSTASTNGGSIDVHYGNGTVSAPTFKDIIRIVVASKMTENLISRPISGMLGLALHTAWATPDPFWLQAIPGASESLMGFWLSRFSDKTNLANEEPGGAFTFGGVNSSLYSGEIEYRPPSQKFSGFYWSIDISALNIQGQKINVNESTKAAVFDMSVAGIGGPPADVRAVWDAVQGSSPTSDPSGFYQYPCSTQLSVTVSFGGRTWPLSSDDMRLARITDDLCLGAIYSLAADATHWAFGIAFLKNVYTVFRFLPDPPQAQVGFAELSSLAAKGYPGSGSPSSNLPSGSRGSGNSPTSGMEPSPSSKKKINAGAIAGGVIGGLALIALLVAFLLFRRRRSRNSSMGNGSFPQQPSRAPLSFVVDPVPEMSNSSRVAVQSPQRSERQFPMSEPSVSSSSPSSSSPPGPSLAFVGMKRQQAAAIPHYGDTYAQEDSLVQTRDGTRLSPGRPSGAQAPSPPALSRPDPVLQELQSLREAVRRLEVEHGSQGEAPPSYDK